MSKSLYILHNKRQVASSRGGDHTGLSVVSDSVLVSVSGGGEEEEAADRLNHQLITANMSRQGLQMMATMQKQIACGNVISERTLPMIVVVAVWRVVRGRVQLTGLPPPTARPGTR